MVEFEKKFKSADEDKLANYIAAIQTHLDEILIESDKNGIPAHRIADTIARIRIEALYPSGLKLPTS